MLVFRIAFEACGTVVKLSTSSNLDSLLDMGCLTRGDSDWFQYIQNHPVSTYTFKKSHKAPATVADVSGVLQSKARTEYLDRIVAYQSGELTKLQREVYHLRSLLSSNGVEYALVCSSCKTVYCCFW